MARVARRAGKHNTVTPISEIVAPRCVYNGSGSFHVFTMPATPAPAFYSQSAGDTDPKCSLGESDSEKNKNEKQNTTKTWPTQSQKFRRHRRRLSAAAGVVCRAHLFSARVYLLHTRRRQRNRAGAVQRPIRHLGRFSRFTRRAAQCQPV